MTEAAIYCRISQDATGEALGVARQEKDCRALCERRGWTVAAVHTDNDTSAYSGRERPAYRRMLAEIKGGTVNAIVAWHPDRLHRSPLELEEFIALIEETGALVATVTSGELDLASPSGRTVARIVGAVARGESEHKSARLRRKHLELAERGRLAGGGRRPFGYETDRVTIRPAEASSIVDAVDRVLAGDSMRSIVGDWNDRGVRSVTGVPWTRTTLVRLLRSRRIAGLREHRGEISAPAVWPGIITPETSARLRAVFDERSARPTRAPRSYLLSGMLTCGACGARMTTRPAASGQHRYVCDPARWNGCGRCGIDARQTEALIVEAVFVALDGPGLRAAINASMDGGDGALEQVAAIEDQLSDLARMWAQGEISRSEWQAARGPLDARLEQARRLLVGTTSGAAVAGIDDIKAAWPALSFDRRRAVISTVIESITIAPFARSLGRFDPDRVTPTWRA